MSGSIGRVLDEARERLLDTGMHNRMVHVNRKIQRGNILNLIVEVGDEVLRQLHEA